MPPSVRDLGTIYIPPDVLVPGRVGSGELSLAKYIICPPGLASDTVGDVIIDRRLALVQPHSESVLYLCPLRPHPQPTPSEAWFYCDCIAYEHDIPAVVYPTRSELSAFRYRYVHSGPPKPRERETLIIGKARTKTTVVTIPPVPPEKVTGKFLMAQLLAILDETRELRHGPLTFVLFRTFRQHRRVHLDYSKWYGKVAKELGLFSAALRQPDFLAEFLGYYRVIEAVAGNNGKTWIAAALGRLPEQKWRPVLLGHDEDDGDTLRNVFGTYSRRAAARLAHLRRQYKTPEQIALYLYKVQRCGIAHGGGNVVRSDLALSYFDVARDTVLVKLLARMAIEEKRR